MAWDGGRVTEMPSGGEVVASASSWDRSVSRMSEEGRGCEPL